VELESIGRAIVESAIKVHTAIGPGLLESAYIACLAYELHDRGLRVRTEVPLPVIYRGVMLEVGYRLDLLVEEQVIVEVKAVRKLHPVHDAQLISYLRLGNRQLGFLLNFHERSMKDGLKRMVNGY
jgi:GxxExxY protein